ncbi:helix-turn-helix domain-containing protein [Ideonella sp. YS5]|uniref:AraC family transcriptional regulator n=1 Tax=Ideonella sp. YS5 TaxID=3453714 RepID=UPI003EE845F2
MPAPGKVLRQTRFANARLNSIGVELMTLAELHARVSARLLLQTERVGFYMVLVATAGHGEHVVDFERFALQAGHVVFVRPGQVQQWQPANGLQADLLLIDPAVMRPAASSSGPGPMALLHPEDWAVRFSMDADGLAAWHALAAMLRQELDRPVLDQLSAAMARELLVCLLLGLSRSATDHSAASTVQAALVRRFRSELEGRVHTRPSVAQLARKLRVSTSTLTRACKEVLGHSAKDEVDRRVALEAQRLLVHSSSTSVAIGELLGFSEPTNFVKFFRRRVGTTPEAFRQAHRLDRHRTRDDTARGEPLSA